MKKILSLQPTIFIALGIVLSTSCSHAQQPTATWQMPAEAKTEWIKIFEMLIPGDRSQWRVTNEGNEFVIECLKPVGFYHFLPGGSGKEPRSRIPSEEMFRVTVAFSPLLSRARFNELKEENKVSEKQHRDLLKKYRINQRFNLFYLRGADATDRAAAYRAEATGLKHQRLPQFFSLDYSITTFQSWHFLKHIEKENQEEVNEVCDEFLNNFRRLFGTYEPHYAKNSGLHSTKSRRLNLTILLN